MKKKLYNINNVIVGLTFLGFQSCEGKFDYSPYVIDFSEDEKQLYQKNLNLLNERKPTNDTLYIAFTGDSHRFYDEFDACTHAVNLKHHEHPIDFLIHVGDLADFGLPRQYQWGNGFLKQLEIPYFVVVGNHDLVGNGFIAYEEMFGTLDFSFIYKNTKFIFVNTNSREFGFDGSVPNLKWLDTELQPNANFAKVIVVFHVPPSDDDFDASLESDFHKTLAHFDNVLFAVHGHLHHYEFYTPYNEKIPYVNVYGVEHEKFNLIKIIGHDFKIETCDF